MKRARLTINSNGSAYLARVGDVAITVRAPDGARLEHGFHGLGFRTERAARHFAKRKGIEIVEVQS